jgi:hypothetical protein
MSNAVAQHAYVTQSAALKYFMNSKLQDILILAWLVLCFGAFFSAAKNLFLV